MQHFSDILDKDFSNTKLWNSLWKEFIQIDALQAKALMKDKNITEKDLENPEKLDPDLVTNIISMISLFISLNRGYDFANDAGVIF